MSDSGPSGSEASNQGEYFYVEKILDVKQEGRNEDARRYRVRWAGYGPQSDTWEPSSNFHPTLLQQFESHYERMRKERVAFLQESGQNVSLEDIVDVNILSKEIEEITKKKTQCGSQRRTFYEVKWQGSKVRTWEMDKDLIHAQDKVDAFLHRIRVSRLNRKTPTCSQDYLSNHEKRVKERAFYEAVEKGEAVSLEMDLYSRVKNGRSSSKEQPSPSKPSSSKTRKRIMQIDSSDETSDEESKVAGEHLGSCSNPKDNREKIIQDCTDNSGGGFLSGLPLFDPQRSQQEFERLERQTLTLSEEEFTIAVDEGDYQMLLASLRSDYVPVLDYTALFLKAARRGRRDIALLLATRVRNLSARDEYGNSAICMAAEQGDICFAHHLFSMGVPKYECNGVGETLQQIASKYGCRHFIRFLQRYGK